MWWRRFNVLGLFLVAACNANAQTDAAADEQQLFNWYYAAIYGTGVYRAGDRTVAVLQAPLSFTLRERSDEQWGLRLTLPVSLGFYDFDFDDLVDQGLPDRVSTISVLPGLELNRYITARWLLRPYFAAGAGWEIGGDEAAWIYDLGARSRFRLGDDRGTRFSLVNWLSLAGYKPSGGSRETLSLFAIGVDVEVPTGKTMFGRPITVSILPIYYYYFTELNFAEFTDPENNVREEGEIALSLLAEHPFRVLGINVDRFGIAIRTSADVSGFRLFTSLPF
ncbi:MAG: hypothetical protein JSU95_00910 [Betaproteobacteria bacterium]|nr:MAG: hypothetical protein JSU95_00910 [Betaproteobacteria bacterium]